MRFLSSSFGAADILSSRDRFDGAVVGFEPLPPITDVLDGFAKYEIVPAKCLAYVSGVNGWLVVGQTPIVGPICLGFSLPSSSGTSSKASHMRR